jgi:hypothetical protein
VVGAVVVGAVVVGAVVVGAVVVGAVVVGAVVVGAVVVAVADDALPGDVESELLEQAESRSAATANMAARRSGVACLLLRAGVRVAT